MDVRVHLQTGNVKTEMYNRNSLANTNVSCDVHIIMDGGVASLTRCGFGLVTGFIWLF
jgi:hypothetical protein